MATKVKLVPKFQKNGKFEFNNLDDKVNEWDGNKFDAESKKYFNQINSLYDKGDYTGYYNALMDMDNDYLRSKYIETNQDLLKNAYNKAKTSSLPTTELSRIDKWMQDYNKYSNLDKSPNITYMMEKGDFAGVDDAVSKMTPEQFKAFASQNQEYINQLPDEYKSQFINKYKNYLPEKEYKALIKEYAADNSGRYRATEERPYKAVSLLKPAIAATNIVLNKRLLDETLERGLRDTAQQHYAGVGPVRPVQGVTPEQYALLQNSLASMRPQKTSDAAANMTSNQMVNREKMAGMNEWTARRADERMKDQERYDTAMREDMDQIAQARTDRSKSVTDMLDYNTELNARHTDALRQFANATGSELHKAINQRAKYNMASKIYNEQAKRQRLNEMIQKTRDAIVVTEDEAEKQSLERQLNELIKDDMEGNYDKYTKGVYEAPDYSTMISHALFPNAIRWKRSYKSGGKLVEKKCKGGKAKCGGKIKQDGGTMNHTAGAKTRMYRTDTKPKRSPATYYKQEKCGGGKLGCGGKAGNKSGKKLIAKKLDNNTKKLDKLSNKISKLQKKHGNTKKTK